MKFKAYITESSTIGDMVKRLTSMGYQQAQKELLGSVRKVLQLLIDKGMEEESLMIINKHLGTTFKSFHEINHKTNQIVNEETNMVNEDMKHFLAFIETQVWGGAVFYPILQLYLELDNLLKGNPDWKRVGVYFVIFMTIMSAKHIHMFNKWKRDNPEEWEQEGKPSIFGIKGDKK